MFIYVSTCHITEQKDLDKNAQQLTLASCIFNEWMLIKAQAKHH